MLGNALGRQRPGRATIETVQIPEKAAPSLVSSGVYPPPPERSQQDALLRLLKDRLASIFIIALLIAAIGCSAALFMPFPYKAVAIVFVDPRDEKVTLQEEVLPGIGTDAAVLESAVQIGKSDGFLIELAQSLKLFPDAQSWTGSADQVRELDTLRKKIEIERMGATYLVQVTYRDRESQEAARFANSIAEFFADTQNRSRSDATENANKALTERLIDIRRKLNLSEDAVARFKASNGIVYVEQNLTVQMRQLTDASQQLALISAAADEAQARYDQSHSNGVITRAAGQGMEENDQLAYLRKQIAQLSQTQDQQRQIYGSRHPRLVETQKMIQGLERQIAEQHQLLGRGLKAERDIGLSKKTELEKQIATLSSEIGKGEAAKVELATLEREATADRDLYQQLLSRNKQTSELALMPTDNARLVSRAVAPSQTTRPPMTLIAPVILFFSFACALAIVISRYWRRYRP